MEKNNLKKRMDLSCIIIVFLFSFIIFFLLFAPFLSDRFGFNLNLNAYEILDLIYSNDPGSQYGLGTLCNVLFIYGLFIYSIIILVLGIKNFVSKKEINFKVYSIILVLLVLVILILTALTEITSNANNLYLSSGAISIIVFSVFFEILLCLGLFLYPQIDFEKVKNRLESFKNNAGKTSSKEEIYHDLEKIKELKDKGILTEDEYETKRKALVDKL